jgi:hypothetical protein
LFSSLANQRATIKENRLVVYVTVNSILRHFYAMTNRLSKSNDFQCKIRKQNTLNGESSLRNKRLLFSWSLKKRI